MRLPPGLKTALPFLGLAAAYGLLARLSLAFVFPPQTVSCFWLPNGMALAWLLLRPREERGPGLAACAAAVIAANLWAGRPWPAATALAVVNVVHLGLGLWMCDRWSGGTLRMNRTRDVVLLALGPAAAAGAAAGLLRMSLVPALLHAEPALRDFLQWWISNALGVLLTAPPLLCWAPRGSPCRLTAGRRAEGLLALAVVVSTAVHVFRRPAGDDTRTYLVVPTLLWAVLRFGPRGASAVLLPFAATAAVLTARGWGPFAPPGGTPGEHLMALHGFLIVTVLCSLLLAAIVREREDARNDAAEARNTLDSMLQRVPAVMWTVDKDLRFTFSRGGLLKTLGLTPDKLLGVRLQDYFGTADPAFPAIKAHREACEGKSSDYRQEWEGRVWQTLVEPFRDAAGNVVGAVGVAQDVTHEREVEEAAHRARKMDALARMASRVAHDFNNSLMAILGYCELLLLDALPTDPRRQDLSAIENAANRAAETAKRLTSFSLHKLNEAHPLDLNALLQEADKELGEVLGPRVSRIYRLEPGLPLVRLDAAQVKEILRQLAANARDAMPDGGQLVVATSRRRGAGAEGRPSPDGDHVRLTLQDTGTGLSTEAKAHIFEPYFTTKPRERDRGLGLATCYGLVKQNDGAISFHSEPGKGTAFHLDFRAWEGTLLPATASAPSGRDASAPLPRGTETLLLAEDEAAVRDSIARILTGLGYKVLAASDGREALALLGKEAGAGAALLLSDVMMPGMNGVELAREAANRRPSMKRLLMSGYAEESLLRDGTLPAGTAFLQKPFSLPTLARRVREVLDAPAANDLIK